MADAYEPSLLTSGLSVTTQHADSPPGAAAKNGYSGFDDPLIIQVVTAPAQGEKELRYLLSIGIVPVQKDKHGKTALEYAHKLNRTELLPMLENAQNQ